MGENQNYKFYNLIEERKKLNDMLSIKVARITKITVTS